MPETEENKNDPDTDERTDEQTAASTDASTKTTDQDEAEEAQKEPKRKIPLNVQINMNRDKREAENRRINKVLEEGLVPQILIESSRLIGPDHSEDARKVIDYVDGILTKLSNATSSKKPPELKIFLADLHGINTGVITKANPPILIVGLGMIDMLHEHGFGEDHLAAILSHERFHVLRHQKWADLDNGRPEEAAADMFGINEAHKAGYKPTALGDFFRVLRKEYQGNGIISKLSDYLDEHPQIDARIRNCELGLANLQLTKRVTGETTPFPDDILAITDALTFETNFDRYQAKTRYDEASDAQKIRLIGDYFMAELEKKEATYERNWMERPDTENAGYKFHKYKASDYNEDLMISRMFEALPELHRMKDIPEAKQAALRQLRRYMSHDLDAQPGQPHRRYRSYDEPSNELHYEWILQQFGYVSAPAPEGLQVQQNYDGSFECGERGSGRRDNSEYDQKFHPFFLRLRTDAQAFWDAKTKDEAIIAAKRFETAEKLLSRYEPGINTLKLFPDDPKWPSRGDIRHALKAQGKIRLPWESHLGWIDNSKNSEERELLERVLNTLNVKDPRLSKNEPSSENKEEKWCADYNKNDNSVYFHQLHFDDHGNITELDLSEGEILAKFQERFHAETAAELYDSEYTIQKQREKDEKRLVKETDWSEMEQDFWAFAEKHALALEPIHSIVPSRYYFAEEFMKRLQKLVKDNPDEWKQTYISFITGHDFDKTDEDRSYYGEDKLVRPMSLPDILSRSESKYFGYGIFYHDFRKSFSGKRGHLPEDHPMYQQLMAHSDTRKNKSRRRKDPKHNRYIDYEVQPKKVAPKDEEVKVPLAIDNRHPFAKALLRYNMRDGYMQYRTRKANLLSNFRYYNPDAQTIEDFYQIDPRRVFNQKAFNSPKAFERFERRYEHHATNQQAGYIWGETRPIELLKTLRKLDQTKPEQRFPISALPYYVASESFKEIFHDKDVAEKYFKELKRLVNRQLSRNRRIDFKARLPLEDLIQRYVDDHGNEYKEDYGYHRRNRGHNIFSFRPHLQAAYQRHIRKRLLKVSLAERLPHLEKLMELEIRDPSFRDWAINQWVEAVSHSVGKDHNDRDYAKNTIELIRHSVETLNASQGISCIVKLLDEIEAQKHVSMEAKEILSDVYGRQFLEKDGAMRVIESAIDTCSHDPELRDAFLEYITEPLSARGTKRFANLVKKLAYSRYAKSDFVKEFFDPERRIVLAPLQEQAIVDKLHQNFWAMPFELRTVYLDRMLFPVRDEEEDLFEKSVQFVLDKVLPKNKKFAPEAREALVVYLDNCPKELRRTTFSAILATTEQAAQKGELRPGEVLSYVLSRTGAAGGQLLQAAHSYLSGIKITDPDLEQFRDDLTDSKVNFDKPKRWEVFERMEEALPEQHIKSIERVGKVLGCGSTAYVIACKKTNKSETALKLMRAEVAEVADLQFERYAASFEELASRHAVYKPLPSMVKNARSLIDTSTNGIIGKDQIDYAISEYNSLNITVNGTPYHFDVAECLTAGKEYIETDRIYGDHLNDMKAGTNKRNVSIAIETAEIFRRLKGGATDKDRHGGQQGIQNENIGMFDVGQVPYSTEHQKVAEPTTIENRAYGQLLGIVFNAAAAKQSAVDALVTAVTENDWGDAHDHIVDEQRSLLARMDVHNGFGDTEEERTEVLTAIFGAVWKTGQIDRDIFKGITETIKPSTLIKLARAQLTGSRPDLHIEIVDQKPENNIPALTTAMALKTSISSGISRIFNRLNHKGAPTAQIALGQATAKTRTSNSKPTNPQI